MTDNFELLKSYIRLQEFNVVHDTSDNSCTLDNHFDRDTDRYYVVELMRRGKDNPDMPAANVHFKNYYINKVSDLDKHKDEIKFLCDGLRMRAYFAVNYKSYQQVAMDATAEFARRVAVHDYKKPYSIYESCSGKYCADGNKTWIIDVDKEDAEKYNISIDELTNIYTELIEDVRPCKKIITIIPTRSGKHIICHPFDVASFNFALEHDYNIEPHSDKTHQIIKKNHLTLLYENI